MIGMTSQQMDIILSTVADGATRDLRYRQRQFISLHGWITAHFNEIEGALCEDGLPLFEARFVIATTLDHLRTLYDGLNLKSELADEYSIKHGRNNPNRRVPEDFVYLIPENFTFFYGVLSVVGTCIAAGSCCLIERPSFCETAVAITLRCLAECLDKSAVIVTAQRPPAAVLAQGLLVDQTGTSLTALNQRVLRSEPDSMTAIVVDRTANLKAAVEEVVAFGTLFSGRSSYAPNCVLVNEFVQAEFLDLLRKATSPNDDCLAKNAEMMNGSRPKAVAEHEKVVASKPQLTKGLFRVMRVSSRSDLRSHMAKQLHEIPLLTVSSHDDAIDALNQSVDKPLLALYVFANAAAAKYLTQFIRTRSSFVNHIPPALLVGPAAPSGYPVSPGSRYCRDMMESPSPQFSHDSLKETKLHSLTSQDLRLGQQLYAGAVKPLRPTGQPKEGDMNFFAQAMLTACTCFVLPLAAAGLLGVVATGVKLYNSLS